MSAKTVTDKGDGREAALRAMQEAAENASGGSNGGPKGPQETRGIVVLSNATSYIPDEKPKKTWGGGGSVEASDEGSETSLLQPRNLSYSSQSARALKSPAKRKKKAKWPPNGDAEEEEGEIAEETMMTMMMIVAAVTHMRASMSRSIMSNSMNGSRNGPKNMASRE